jgi:hypothetical protein
MLPFVTRCYPVFFTWMVTFWSQKEVGIVRGIEDYFRNFLEEFRNYCLNEEATKLYREITIF